MVNCEIRESSAGQLEVRLEGDLVLGSDGAKVWECLNPLVRKFPQVTVDLNRLRRIDSTGIGILVMTKSIARDNGNLIQVVNVTGVVRDVLLLVKLLTVFDGVSAIPKSA